MLIDSNTLEDRSVLTADVCIIGGGVAGITMALEFEKQGIDTLLLESGGVAPDPATRDLYRGESTEIYYRFADGCRSRFLGGSSNCWGGWCRPLDPHDFAKRDWIPYSGWPITADDLAPYYPRTHHYLGLGPYDFDIQHWIDAIGRDDVTRVPLPTGRVYDTISQFSPPVRMGLKFGDELRAARHVRTLLRANVTFIESDREGTQVQRLQVRTLAGKEFQVTARVFVLATGGIENARLLLASNRIRPNGLGNDHDMVGRFFMDHPRIYSGSIRHLGAWQRNRLFDVKYHYQSPLVSAHGTAIAGAFALTHETQERERIGNARVWFESIFPGDRTEASEALIRIKHRLEQKEPPDTSLANDLAILARHPLDSAGFVLARYVKSPRLIRKVVFAAIVEPEPDPDARVTLSPDRRDALGMPRVRVGWKLGQITRRTFDRSFAVLADELQRAGAAEVRLDPTLEGGTEWPTSLNPEGTWHHMGTTRMHESPKLGVVDPNCRIHGMSNLYVAGSSVFTTAGSNFPTQTLAALALRLSDHLQQVLRDQSLPDRSAALPGRQLESA